MGSYSAIRDVIENKIAEGTSHGMLTKGQVESWYHSQILRIPHGKQHPKKRYLREEEIIDLFRGTAHIQEKVDGKMSSLIYNDDPIMWMVVEDMTGKRTVHDHIIKYKTAPYQIHLDIVRYADGRLIFESIPDQPLEYATISLIDPTIEQIHSILEPLSRLPSHHGFPVMEGVVIKNYDEQRAGKWINEEFEDMLFRE